MAISQRTITKLIEVTEKSVALWNGTDVSPQSAHVVFSQACATFTELAQDKEFKEWLHITLHVEGAERMEAARKLLENIDEFVRFLSVEKSILVEAGLSNRTADLLLHHMTVFRHEVTAQQAVQECNYDALDRGLSAAAKSACDAAATFGKVEHRHRRWLRIRRIGLEAGGWTIIGANGAAFVAELVQTFGLSALTGGGVSLASTALGQCLIAGAKRMEA